MKMRQEIKELAREGMALQRGNAILIVLVYMLISSAWTLLQEILNIGNVSVNAFTLLSFLMGGMFLPIYVFISMPLLVGMYGACIKIYNKAPTGVGEMFSGGFDGNYLRKVGGMAWVWLWIILWSLLLVIPGIVKLYSYSMTPFILAQFPKVTATEALKISMRMTHGYKADIFFLGLSFIGWYLLFLVPTIILRTILAPFLGQTLSFSLAMTVVYSLYVMPYYYTALAGLYQELRDKALAEGRVTYEELGMAEPVAAAPHQPMVIY